MENNNSFNFENKTFDETLAQAKSIAKEQLVVLTSETEKLNALLDEIERMQKNKNIQE